MPVLDNSPTKGYVRWYDTKLVYQGVAYRIKDGHSDKKYVYWEQSDPFEFKSSDILPVGEVYIIYINNGGIISTYPCDKGVFIDSLSSASSINTVLYEHLSNEGIHNTENFRDLVELISNKLEGAILRIEELEKKIK